MAAEGETNLASLIRSMSPSLDEETYVFGHIPAKTDTDFQNILKLFVGIPVQMLFREDKGWTVITSQKVAEEIQMQSVFPCKRITLRVHSSLEAVGFMTAITTKLTELNTGVNPVSGYYHDHLFVPLGKEQSVLEALKTMATEQSC